MDFSLTIDILFWFGILWLNATYWCSNITKFAWSSLQLRPILYYLDVELTKILRSNVTSQVAPHMCVFQTNRWNANSVPFILKRWTHHSNSHIFVCVCHILPNKIAEALILLWFVTLPSILQEVVMRKQKILAKIDYLICQVCFLTCPIICVPNISFCRLTVDFFDTLSSAFSFLLFSSNL